MTTAAHTATDTAQDSPREVTNVSVRAWVDAFQGDWFAPIDVVRDLPECSPADVRSAVSALCVAGVLERLGLGAYMRAGGPVPESWTNRPKTAAERILHWIQTEGAAKGAFTTDDVLAGVPEVSRAQVSGVVSNGRYAGTIGRVERGVYRYSPSGDGLASRNWEPGARRCFAVAAGEAEPERVRYGYDDDDDDYGISVLLAQGTRRRRVVTLTDADLCAALDALTPSGFSASAAPHIAEWLRLTRTILQEHTSEAAA